MNIQAEKKNNATVLIIKEENIDIGNSVDFRDVLAKQTENEKHTIVLDMKGVKYIDSSGIGVLITFLRHTQDTDRFLKLANCNPKVVETMKTTRLDNEIPMFGTLEEALSG